MRRVRCAIAVTVIGLFVATAGASAAGGPVYAGGSPKANRYMDIEIQVLAGHAVPGGFAGTFHYHESQPPAYRCDSHVLYWRARRRAGGFP